MAMELQSILDDYNYYRSYTAHVQQIRAKGGYVRQLQMRTKKEDRQPLFQAMVDFCQEYRLDPKLWLYLLFKIRGWRAAPRVDQLVPKSRKTLQKNLELYADLSDLPLFQKYRHEKQQTAAVQNGTAWDVNRDIGYSTEALKRRYINEGDAERCLSELEERTYGFHPRSLVCARCPLKTECTQKLEAKFGAHIVPLRRGDITIQQAQQLTLFRNG
jgi:hypothetical protein